MSTQYILKFSSDKEVFVKVGRSFNIPSRKSNFPKEYEIELIASLSGTHYTIFNLEQSLLEDTIEHLYSPKHTFKGNKECRDVSCLDHIINKISYNT